MERTKAVELAVTHYKSRKSQILYKAVPVACVLLTGGIIGSVLSRGFDAVSLLTLGLTFCTAFNNGANVVEPAKSLDDRSRWHEILAKIFKGHFLDVAGFTAIFALIVLF